MRLFVIFALPPFSLDPGPGASSRVFGTSSIHLLCPFEVIVLFADCWNKQQFRVVHSS